MTTNEKLGNNLRYYRKQQGLTLKEMSERLDISLPTYQKYETGQIKHIDIDNVKQFASVLDVAPQVLLGWEEEKENLESDILKNVMELCCLDEEKDEDLINALQNKLSAQAREHNNILNKIGNIEETYLLNTPTPLPEEMRRIDNSDSVSPDERQFLNDYEKATPEVQSAIQTLLKLSQ